MTSEVTDLLKALNDGRMTLEEIVLKFKARRWPRPVSRPATYAELAKIELEDPEPYIPGSFDDVTIAYHRGDLSDQQYDALAAAMAESKEAEDNEL